MISSLGLAMLWLCPWSGWVTSLVSGTIPSGYRVEAGITDWYLLKRESANLVMLRREDGHVSFKLERAFGFVLWTFGGGSEVWNGAASHPLADDSVCSGTRSRVAGKSSPPPESSAHSRIAGQNVVVYRWRPEDRDVALAFAPALGCQLMLLREIHYGRLGLPIGISEFRVTSIRRAGREPDLVDAAQK